MGTGIFSRASRIARASASHRSRSVLVVLLLLVALGSVLAACGTSSTSGVQTPETPLMTTDANGTTIKLPTTAPTHIVSLTPTASEVLAALNLTSDVIGVDTFTDYPADIAAKPKVTDENGSPNVEQIIGLKPDLVLSYGGLKTQEQKLLQAGVNLIDLPITNLSTSITEIRLVGQLTGAESAANTLADSMQQRIDQISSKLATATHPKVYMEIGYTPAPPYTYGGGSFGDELITDAGGVNIFHSDTDGGGYPAVSDEQIIAAAPEVIILTEPAAYGGDPATVAKRNGWSVIPAVKQNHVYAIDPNLLQRPGPRIVDGLEALAKDIHPELFS